MKWMNQKYTKQNGITNEVSFNNLFLSEILS